MGSGSKSGRDNAHFVPNYSTFTSSRGNHDSDDRPDYPMKIFLPHFNGKLKI